MATDPPSETVWRLNMATDPPTTTVVAKVWWQSRTLAVNSLGLVIIIIGIILDSASILALPPQALAYLGVLLAIANAMLRFTTSQPLASGPHQTAEVEAPAVPPTKPSTLTEISDTSGNHWCS